MLFRSGCDEGFAHAALSAYDADAVMYDAKRLLFVTGMGVTGYGFTLTLNSSWALLWTFILGTDTTEAAQHTAEQMQSAPLWFLILVIAVTPAICEELFFRGLLLKSYAAAPAAALCMSSALFSLLHYDVLRLFPTFYLGMFFGWVVMRTGNLTAGMILHFLNNTFSGDRKSTRLNSSYPTTSRMPSSA